MYIDIFSFPAATSQTNFTAWLGNQICLRDITHDGIRHFACNFHDIFTFLLDRTWKSEYDTDFLQNAVHLAVEVHAVVDDTQMRMTCPRLNDLLVQHSRNFQSFFIGTFVARSVVGSRIELFGTISGTHQMEHSIIAAAEFWRACSNGLGDVFPDFRLHIGRDVHRTSVTYDDGRSLTGLGHFHELILQSQLNFQCGFLAFIEEITVVSQIVHACLRKHGWHFRDGKNLIAKT